MGLHGKPDWGLQLKSTIYSMDDLAELAVRLGSEVFFDRRGDVLFKDNFDSGLSKWYAYGNGDDNKQLVTPEMARSGGYSIKLIGGSTSPWRSIIRTSFPYPVLSKLGLEVHFCITHTIDRVTFELIQDNSDYSYEAAIQFDRVNANLQYKDILGDYQDIDSDYVFLDRYNLFHVIKLVADFEAQKYHRLIVNEITHDLSAHAVYKGGSQGSKFCEIRITLYSRDLYNDHIYIDNVIVTQNEP